MSVSLDKGPAPESPEQGGKSSVDYAKMWEATHPNPDKLVQDPAEARVMADASLMDEQEVAEKRQDAVRRTSDLGLPFNTPETVANTMRMAENTAAEAQAARVRADEKAEFAQKIYKQVKDL